MIETVADLYDEFRSLVAIVSGLDESRVIFASRGRPEPFQDGGVYATHNPIPVRAYGHPVRSVSDTDGPIETTSLSNWNDLAVTRITQMEFILSVNILNSGARNVIIRFPNAQFREPVRKKLNDMDIAWRYTSEVRSLTEVQQGGYQSRYQIDVHLIVPMSITDDVLKANGVDITVEDEDGNILTEGAA